MGNIENIFLFSNQDPMSNYHNLLSSTLIKREMPMNPLEVDLDDTLPNNQETGDEYIDTIEGSDQWSNWRDTLANQMYNEWLANRM
ncbi:unnamed protein product [Camellia sinensis]